MALFGHLPLNRPRPAVDVAGKYRYAARDPAGGEPLPVLLDVLLVGRTKILKLHGPLWASNSTCHKLGITLAMPAAANGAGYAQELTPRALCMQGMRPADTM